MDPLKPTPPDQTGPADPVAQPPAAAGQVAPAAPQPSNTPPVQSARTPATDEQTNQPPREGWRSVMSTIAIVIAAPIIAVVLTAFVFQSYQVDGPSMESTLQNNDRLIVWKVPRTWSRLTGHTYLPNRSDVIIFVKHNLYENGLNQDKQLVKRVIGLPGDRVVVNNGVVTVYNADHPKGYNPDATYPYGKVVTSTPGNLDLTVPANEVFVSGDNRANSLDSRSFGTIPVSDIVGKLVLRMYPVSQITLF